MAKNIFATDFTLNQEEGVSDGEAFITARVDKETEDYIDKSADELLAQMKKLTKPISVLKGIVMFCGFALFLIIAAAIRAISGSEITVGEAFQKAPVAFIAAAVLAFAGIASFALLLKKEKSFLKSDEKLELDRKLENIKTFSLSQLGVTPGKTVEFDILSLAYEIKNGEMKVTHKKLFDYAILSADFFIEDSKICLCFNTERYDIPLSQVKALHKIRSKVKVDCWMKDESPDSYKNSGKIYETKDGTVHFAPYYSLEIEKDGNDYELLFPFWEYETFVNQTGIKADED